MANFISNEAAGLSLRLSNGATGVLLSVLVLAGSDLAQSTWEQELVTWLAEHDQTVLGTGMVSFDVQEIAWTCDGFDDEKAFVLNTIDHAQTRHRWDALGYDPPYALQDLVTFRALVQAISLESIRPGGTWDWLQRPEAMVKCPLHEVYVHALGCLLCNDEPLDKTLARTPPN